MNSAFFITLLSPAGGAGNTAAPVPRTPAADGKLSPMIATRPLRTRAVRGVIGIFAAGLVAIVAAQSPTAGRDVVTLGVARPGLPISPTMYGVFFEDINFAADGGLYPERVRNRSFEFTEPLYGWRREFSSRGELVVRTDGALHENNPHYLRLRSLAPDGGFSVVNSGFRGMGVESGADYVLSAYVRAQPGGPRQLTARLTDEKAQSLAEASLAGFTGEWSSTGIEYAVTLDSPASVDELARLTAAVDDVAEIPRAIRAGAPVARRE